jgi:hypothetical protein
VWEREVGRDGEGAIAEPRSLTRRCNGLLRGADGVVKVFTAVELHVRPLGYLLESNRKLNEGCNCQVCKVSVKPVN